MKFFKQIRKNPLFCDMTDSEIEDVFECLEAKVVKYSARDIVIRPEEKLEGLYIILEGNLVEFVLGNNNTKKVVSSKVDGDMFGVPNCFLDPRLSRSFVTATIDSTVLYVKAEGLYSTCEKACPCHTKLIANLVKYLASAIVELQQNKDFITIRGMRKKIASFILDKYNEQGTLDVHLGVDRNGMAKYLNVSRPSMSREMINMREEGIFEFRKDFIKIKDIERLRKISAE